MERPETTAFASFLQAPRRAALLVDYDGSLAPIVADPAAARPLPASVATLDRLVAGLGRVAVVSGRPAWFLAERLPVPGLVLVGLYGLERVTDGTHWVDPRAEPWAPAIAAAADELDARLPGVLVERKSDLAVTVHWRTAPDRADDALRVAHEVSATHGLDAPMRGRMAVELRPPVAIDKGSATEALVTDMRAAAFAGDDLGDVPAFVALDRLRRDGALEVAVSIGVRSVEAPDAVLGADVVVDGPEGLVALLEALADALE